MPPGQILPHQPEASGSPFRLQYKVLLGIGIGLWIIGLVAILLYRRRGGSGIIGDMERPLTVAEKLRPLVERAIAGQLSQSELADLERTLIHYWRRRLGLNELKPGQMIHALRRNSEAGPLLTQLEKWLHQPGASSDVDVAELLRPYQNLPAEEWEA